MLTKMIYKFGTITDGASSMKEVLGGKGANLAEMSKLGIPVPPGFTIPCSYSVEYHKASCDAGSALFMDLQSSILQEGMSYISHTLGLEGVWPLVSVRSGARVSMPGMMDTILNVGLTDDTLPFWKEKLGERTALDSYRRLIQMYAGVALDVPMVKFDHNLENRKKMAGVVEDKDLSAYDLEQLVLDYLEIVKDEGKIFPQSAEEQIWGATEAVFRSWMNPRAIEYRKIYSYPEDWGTAVTIQSMVFGNWNDNSATGVLFSRDPATGDKKVTGEFLINAQGEDVVAGIRTPIPLDKMCGPDKVAPGWGIIHHDLLALVHLLEKHYKDMQDIEFTVQDGKLFLLQTRNGKRSAKAAFQIAYDMAMEGLITRKEASSRVTKEQLLAILVDAIDPKFKKPPHLVGIAAGGGLVTGVAVFSSEDAVNCTEPCILVRKETDPDDIAGMHQSLGILTATGGLTSHAAVVARGMNKSCVVGCTDLIVKEDHAEIAGGVEITSKDSVTLDGATGRVWIGTKVPVIPGGITKEAKSLMLWRAEGSLIAERLSLHQGMTEEQMVEVLSAITEDNVHVDLGICLQKGLAGELVARLGAALLKMPSNVTKVVIDLATKTDYYGASDIVFDRMFGYPEDTSNAAMILEAVVSVGNTWCPTMKETVFFKMPTAGSEANLLLEDFGWNSSSTVQIHTFADLLNSDGEIEVSPTVIKMVFGTKGALDAAMDMLVTVKGKDFNKKKAIPTYWYDLINPEV